MAATTSDTNALRNRLSAQASTATTAAGATAAPAKPWEQRLASRSSIGDTTASATSLGSAAARASTQVPLSTSTAEIGGGLQASNGAYSTANSQMNNGMMNSTGSMMNSGYGGVSSYNSPGYGAMGSTYGSTGYGSTGYGGYGGGLSSYGGMSSYGGGLGGGYGGYGGGYGSTYGGGYGMSRYGGYGGGMMGGGMGGMDPNGQMGFLHSFSQTVGSLGQITEMLGMNAEALNFCVGSFVNFVERIGAMCAGMASMVTPRPDFPPGHPMHGQPPTEEEERSRKRRVRIFQFLFSMIALTSMYKFLRWLGMFKSKARKALAAPPTPAMNRNLERIFQNTAGGRSRALLQ